MGAAAEQAGRRALEVSPSFNGPRLRPTHPHVVLRGARAQGIQFLCGRCGKVLADQFAEEQVWGVGIECFECEAISVFPDLPSHLALPSNAMLVDRRAYSLSETINVHGVVIACADLDRSTRDRAWIPPGGSRAASGEVVGSLGVLAEWDSAFCSLLGSRITRELSRFRRGRVGATTPSRELGLVRLIEVVRTSIAMWGVPSTQRADDFAEAMTLRRLIDHWKHHPAWESIRASIAAEYSHTLVLLAAASVLQQVGNGVIFEPAGAKRTPDLRIVLGAERRAAVELKVPETLVGREACAGQVDPVRIVEKAVKRAGSGARGQLGADPSSLLIIGALFPPEGAAEAVHRAADAFLTRCSASTPPRKTGLLGIVVAVLDRPRERMEQEVERVQGGFSFLTATNPGYRGKERLTSVG